MNDRDHFAAAALTGLLAGRTHEEPHVHADQWAQWSMQLADAMLAARGPVADPQESQHVAETCRGEGHDAAPPQPPASSATLTDAEREAVRRILTVVRERLWFVYADEICTVDGLLARLGGGA